MHLLFREAHSLDELDAAVDLGQSPADMVFLSFADTDLAAAAAAYRDGCADLPTLRLANIGKLKHPLSVDVYVEDVISRARIVVARLLGGLEYWRYGIEEVVRACAGSGIPLALVSGDGRRDRRLAELSTVRPEDLATLITRIADGTPSGKMAKDVFEAVWRGEGNPDSVIEERGLVQISDTAAIEALVDEVLATCPVQVKQYRDGKEKVFGFLVGQVMKITRGQANPEQVNKALRNRL